MRSRMMMTLAASLLLGLFVGGPAEAQDHHRGPHHHGEEGRHGPMMGHMMEDCPMMEGMHGEMMGMMGMMGMGMGMMGPAALLEHADDLDLTDEQMAALEGLADEHEEVRRRMMEARDEIHELLTPEQMETLHEEMMRGGSEHMRRMHESMHGDEHDESPRGGAGPGARPFR